MIFKRTKYPGQNGASTAAPLYTLLKIRNRVKTKDAHFVQDYWKRTIFPFFWFFFWIFLFYFFLDFLFLFFSWIFLFYFFGFFLFPLFLDVFLILNQRNFLTFHPTRVFLPSSHKDVLIFQLFHTSAFLNFSAQFFQIFTTQEF